MQKIISLISTILLTVLNLYGIWNEAVIVCIDSTIPENKNFTHLLKCYGEKKIIKTITNTNSIEELYELLKSCRKTGLKKPYNSCFCIYISGDTTLTAIGGTKDMLIGNSLYETTDELLTKIYELSEFNHTRCLNLNDVNVEDVECVEIKSVPPNIFTPRDVIFYEFEDFFKSVLKRKIVTNKQCILQIIDMLTMGKKYENNSNMPIIDTRFVIDIHLCKNNEIIKIYGNESFFVVGNNIYQTDNLLSDFVWRTGRMCCDTLSCKHFHTERKESLSFEGLHWYDNHARIYDPLLMRFTTPDPLAAQFPSVSPYAYCNNNPVNFIDPDGRLVLFAPNVSETFKQEFSKAVKYMNRANTSGDLKYLNSIKEVYYIAETNSFNGRTGNRFEGETKTIYWNPYAAMKTFNNSLLSPVTMLVHELGHGANHHKNKKEYITQKMMIMIIWKRIWKRNV